MNLEARGVMDMESRILPIPGLVGVDRAEKARMLVAIVVKVG